MAKRTFCRRCFEMGRTPSGSYDHGADCLAYDAQLAFTRRVRRLLADRTPWDARPVPPAPDYSTPEAVTRECFKGGTADPLPAGGLGDRFVKALRATGPGWERDVLKAWPRAATRKEQAA